MADHIIESQDSLKESPLLPIELPLSEALTVYFGRLLIFVAVILVNVLIFATYIWFTGVKIVQKSTAIVADQQAVTVGGRVMWPASILFEDDFEKEFDRNSWIVVEGYPTIVDGKLTSAYGELVLQPKYLLRYSNSIDEYAITSEWVSDGTVYPLEATAFVFGDSEPVRFSINETTDGYDTSWQRYSDFQVDWIPSSSQTSIRNSNTSYALIILSSSERMTAVWADTAPLILRGHARNATFLTIHVLPGAFLESIKFLIPQESADKISLPTLTPQ